METFFIESDLSKTLILIGHAYNPFTMQADEHDILRSILSCNSDAEYRNYIDQLTGLFVLITISDDETITAICDCAGMMGAYYSVRRNCVYFSSHAQIIAELLDLKEDSYVSALKKSPTFHYYGLFLPFDLSPYEENMCL